MITTVTLNPSVDRMYFVKSFNTDKVVRCDTFNVNAGGKGLNVTKVLKQLGASVQCLGFLGGMGGSFINEKLTEMDVLNYFTWIKGSTRSCISIMPEKGKQFELIESGPEIFKAEVDLFMSTFEEKIVQSRLVVLSGSLPKGVSLDFYRILIEKAKKNGVKTILDTSGIPLLEGLKARPYLIKPNVDELKEVLGKELYSENDFLEGVLRCMEMGAENVAISLGNAGMIFSSLKESYRVRVPKIDLVNPVGSGDATVAGLSYGLSEGMEIKDVLILANACGASNATSKAIGSLNEASFKDILGKIEVYKIRG